MLQGNMSQLGTRCAYGLAQCLCSPHLAQHQNGILIAPLHAFHHGSEKVAHIEWVQMPLVGMPVPLELHSLDAPCSLLKETPEDHQQVLIDIWLTAFYRSLLTTAAAARGLIQVLDICQNIKGTQHHVPNTHTWLRCLLLAPLYEGLA